MFFYKNNIEEKELLCDTIEKYIDIANKNNNTLDDYVSVIAFINTLKTQYPNYSKSFNYYLNKFETKGLIEYYNSNNKNIAKKYLAIYKNDLSKAEEIINGFIPDCSNRFINFMIGIGICGKPNDKKRRLLLARAYSWNSYSFARQAIYYTNLSLNDNKNDIWLLELNGENYLKIKDYDKSLEYYKKALQKSNNSYLFRRIVSIYKKKADLDGAITFLNSEKRKKIFNRELYETIKKELNSLENEKIGIYKHDFSGYNAIESFWGKFDNYKKAEEKYKLLKTKYKSVFDEHIKRLDNISVIMTAGLSKENIDEFILNIKEDIENFYKINNFYEELNSFGLNNYYYYSDNYIKGYLLPKKTIIFLEKNDYLDEAILVCDISIKNNITWDNTKSGIIGRKERLIKKKNKLIST